MWNATTRQIPESDISSEHMRVLEKAVAEAEEFPVSGKDVQRALNYFTARTDRQGGINLFLYGMRENRIDCMIEGLKRLRTHLGMRKRP